MRVTIFDKPQLPMKPWRQSSFRETHESLHYSSFSPFLSKYKQEHRIFPRTLVLIHTLISPTRIPQTRTEAMNHPNPPHELHSEADEQTQIRIDKGIVEERFQTYFPRPRYRIVLDDAPPTITRDDIDADANTIVHELSAANVALRPLG